MANKNLTYQIFGKDRSASKTMDSVAKRAGKLAARLSKWVVGIVAAMATAVGAFAVSSVKAAGEAEKAQNRLALAWSKSAKTNDVALESLREYNSELQKTTKYDDDLIASAQVVLSNFKLTGAQIQKLTPLLLDYASRTGKDLPSAATDLGKALLGQGRALKAIGIDFKTTGDASKDFNRLVAALSAQVGGFAASEATTLEGKLAILKNRFGEIQESVGAALIDPLLMVAGIIETAVLPKLEELSAWFGEEGPAAFEKIAPLLPQIAEKFVEIWSSLVESGALDALMQLAVDLLPVLADVLIALIPLIPTLAWAVQNLLLPPLQLLASSIAGINALVGGNRTELINWLKGVQALKGPLGDFSRWLATAFVTSMNAVTRVFNAVSDGIENLINSFSALSGVRINIPKIRLLTTANITGQGFTPSGSSAVRVPGAVAGRFAEGGIVPARPGGWLANVGEGGQAEAIIPLDRLGGLGGGGDTFQIHVTGYVGDENKLVQKLAKAVQDAKSRGAVPRGAFT